MFYVILWYSQPPVPDQSSVRHGVNPGDAIPVVHSGGMGSELIDLSDGSVSEREDTKLAVGEKQPCFVLWIATTLFCDCHVSLSLSVYVRVGTALAGTPNAERSR